MKQFLKMTLAVIVGCLVVGSAMTFLTFGLIGSLATLGNTPAVMPRSAILKIDFNDMQLGEQTVETSPLEAIQGNNTSVVGILDAIRAIETAAEDPAVKYIYMKPDMVTGGMAEIEELRGALENFRKSGKAVLSYIENPGNAGYYLATASDKIYMTPHPGGLNMLTGISSQMVFLKDILDKLGVNVQLIRHGKFKSAGEMFTRSGASDENMLQNQELINSIWNSWCSEIADARNVSAEKFNEAIDNLELNLPEDFLKAGLVDELLTQDQLKEKLTEYFNATGYDQVAMIGLRDYASLKVLPNYRADNTVAVIYASGNIVDGNDIQQVAGDRFAKIISDLRNDESVKAVVFRVNSPGGSVLASEKIRNEISLLSEKKPVVASYGNYAASGGYWISSGCDHIFTNNTTLTGSIGVFSMIPDFSKTLDNVANVNITSVNSNRHSDIYSTLRPLTKEETEYMQASVEDIYDKFTTIVAEGRSLGKEYVDSVAQGRVWSGHDALGIGLADQKGSVMDAVRFAVAAAGDGSGDYDLSEWNIAEYPKPLTTLEMLLQAVDGSSSAKIFAGTPFENVEKTFRTWSGDLSGKVYARMPYELYIR